MQIILLGSGGYHPNRRRHTACCMIPKVGVVLDAGTGAFGVQERVVTESVDVFLSHAHLDHVFGLTNFLGVFDGDEAARIRVHGEPDKLAAVRKHLFSGLLFPVAPPLTFVELTCEVELRGGGRLTWFPLPGHPGGSVGYRLEWPGHSMAYVTDTVAAADAEYLPHIAGVDLLIHEAYFDDRQRELAELTGHSCVTDVAELAAEAGVGQLVLVHMNPRSDGEEPLDATEARKRYPGLQFGADGMAIEF